MARTVQKGSCHFGNPSPSQRRVTRLVVEGLDDDAVLVVGGEALALGDADAVGQQVRHPARPVHEQDGDAVLRRRRDRGDGPGPALEDDADGRAVLGPQQVLPVLVGQRRRPAVLSESTTRA